MNNEIVSRFHVGGMDCAACGTKVSNAVNRIEGVRQAEVAITAEVLTVHHDGNATPEKVGEAVKRLGYTLSALSADADAEDGAAKPKKPVVLWWRTARARLTAACGFALLIAYGLGIQFPQWQTALFLAALAIGLIPVGWRAIVAALSGSPFSIEMLMTLAAIGAIIIGATEEAAVVVLLFLIGELLENIAADRARASISSLTSLVPKTAFVIQGGITREVQAAELRRGMVIRVRPGDRIPADGDIIEGQSAINEAPVTGESVPVHKKVGDQVLAGTVNSDAALTIKVTSEARDNTIARVVKLVEQAQEHKAPTERFIERFSRYYTPGVLILSAAIAILPPIIMGGSWTEWFYKSLAVLLIGCPCALVISTPAAIASALAAGARHGLLVKGGGVLEQAGKLTAIAFDKTGTLTAGKPEVTDVLEGTHTEAKILSLAASLEQSSSHPLALAILKKASERNAPIPPVRDAKAMPGKGVSGSVGGEHAVLISVGAFEEKTTLESSLKQKILKLNQEGKTVSLLVVNEAVAGLIAMRDEPREDASKGLRALRDSNVRIIMLTGDNATTAAAIGNDLKIEVRGELLPADKLEIVKQLKAEGAKVGKVGDGINDAPALAEADIGIAMGGGTDVALETADAAVLHGRVLDVWRLMQLSRRTMRNIYQNITLSLGLKAVFLVTTLLGVTGLWPAILADTGATVLVTANAMRLLRYGVPN